MFDILDILCKVYVFIYLYTSISLGFVRYVYAICLLWLHGRYEIYILEGLGYLFDFEMAYDSNMGPLLTIGIDI